MSLFNRYRIRRNFSRAAAHYDEAAALQREIGMGLLESLVYAKAPPRRVLDLGCGTGFFTRLLKRRFPRALVVGLDLAEGMLTAARARQGWLRRFRLVQGDALALPFAEGAFDLVFSNLLLQWLEDPERALAEARRVLAPGGLLLFSTFGPETLAELAAALGPKEAARRINPFPPPEWLGERLLALGFRHPVLERELRIRRYPSFRALAAELKALGARNAMPGATAGLGGKAWAKGVAQRFEAGRAKDGLIPVRWEAVWGIAFAPAAGEPSSRPATSGEALVPAERIPVRRRSA
jgi:malonyl-CoA O-methyltransferase